MSSEEKKEFLDKFWQKIYKRGIPINVRNGSISDIATWAQDIADDCIPDDEPLGVLEDEGKDRCPKCKKIMGTSGFFCKYCGAHIRAVLY